jgi:hypothetical protein
MTELTREGIVELLKKSDKAVCRALLVINSNQTADEQISETTTHLNGRGFRPFHAAIGTSMANFYQRNSYLTPKQIAYWRKTDCKGNMNIGLYWKQLVEAAKQKASV